MLASPGENRLVWHALGLVVVECMVVLALIARVSNGSAFLVEDVSGVIGSRTKWSRVVVGRTVAIFILLKYAFVWVGHTLLIFSN